MGSESTSDFSDVLSEIMTKVHDAKLRRTEHSTEEVCVVAVSKTKPVEAILRAYECGCRHFGENYVNELAEKAFNDEIMEMCPDIKWHFIGHLQSNKVNKVIGIPNLYMIQTIDSMKLADLVDKACAKTQKQEPLKIMIQVNTSGEESKSGIELDEINELIQHVIENCPHLKCVGIMTIGYASHDLSQGPNPEYQALLRCRASVCEDFNLEHLDLSMGMSHDFEHAIELGSTCVRIGSALFGARAKKPKYE